jgi:predicted mannosyl-3-phosphoglycerate phosphatase (HAD superfamily)
MPKLGVDGKPLKDENGGNILEQVGINKRDVETVTTLTPNDIGKELDHWKNEEDILRRYSLAFEKV